MDLLHWGLLAAGATAASCAGVYLVRKFGRTETLKDHHDATDPMMACVGTLFAILLGFMVANAMTRFEEARINAQEEAGAVGDVFRLSRGLPAPTSTEIMKNCVAYLDAVSKLEFESMRHDQMNDKCWDIYSNMWQQCTAYDPKTQGQSNLHQGLVQAMTKFGECRRARNAELSYQLPTVLWAVVWAGAISIVFFTFLFAIENMYLQMAMTSVITLILFLNIYLLAAFDDPFNGEVFITPVPFESNLKLFNQILSEELAKKNK
jgi:hypothetical protein